MKKYILSAILVVTSLSVFAQKPGVEVTASVQTNHLWRGQKVSEQPIVSAQTIFNLDSQGKLTAGFWGGMAISTNEDHKTYREIDAYVQYASNGFSIGLWDLYNSTGLLGDVADIWNYSDKTTGHLLDLRTSYHFGEQTPFRLEADVLLYGSGDSRLDGSNVVQKYSTYLQASYDFSVSNGIEVTPFAGVGFALNGDKNNYDIYGTDKNFELVNLGLTAKKTLALSSTYSLPVSISTVWNPAKKYARVQLAATIF